MLVVDFGILVLTAGSWPVNSTQPLEFQCPDEVGASLRNAFPEAVTIGANLMTLYFFVGCSWRRALPTLQHITITGTVVANSVGSGIGAEVG